MSKDEKKSLEFEGEVVKEYRGYYDVLDEVAESLIYDILKDFDKKKVHIIIEEL